jgi:hypothetical protein
MLGLGYANITGAKAASGGVGDGTVVGLYHFESPVIADSKLDSSGYNNTLVAYSYSVVSASAYGMTGDYCGSTFSNIRHTNTVIADGDSYTVEALIYTSARASIDSLPIGSGQYAVSVGFGVNTTDLSSSDTTIFVNYIAYDLTIAPDYSVPTLATITVPTVANTLFNVKIVYTNKTVKVYLNGELKAFINNNNANWSSVPQVGNFVCEINAGGTVRVDEFKITKN